jgi:thiol-disulfide isomerase/thioredoxin
MRDRYEGAQTFAEFLSGVQKHEDFWRSLARRARVPAEILDRARALPDRWHLLVLLEDWCGDAFNTIPYLSALAEAVPNLGLRVLGRDANPDLMDAHLTNGSRSIPVVMVLDHEYHEVGWWGPRPRELQEWVLERGLQLPAEERYAEVRRWYAQDGGRTSLDEVVSLIEESATKIGAFA